MPTTRNSNKNNSISTENKRKRVSNALGSESNKKGKKSNSDEKSGSNSSSWRKKFMLEEETESKLAPYEHWWNLLSREDKNLLFFEGTIDNFPKSQSEDDEKVAKVIEKAIAKSNALQRKKIHGELYLKFFSELRRENDNSGLSLREKMLLAKHFADNEMK